MAQSKTNAALESELYKAYFDDPTLSDLTIRLTDRSLHVHRIVLCRGSGFFTSLLLSGSRGSERKEIDFHSEDPDAMVAVLRYIYDLPHDGHDPEKYRNNLQLNVAVYAIAEKYQIKGLQLEAYDHMQAIIASPGRLDPKNSSIPNLIIALRKILTCTTKKQDKRCRKLMVDACIKNFPVLRKEAQFLSLIKDFGDLGAEILASENLDILLPGALVCCCCSSDTSTPICPVCAAAYDEESISRHSDEVEWTCPSCSKVRVPICEDCEDELFWMNRRF